MLHFLASHVAGFQQSQVKAMWQVAVVVGCFIAAMHSVKPDRIKMDIGLKRFPPIGSIQNFKIT
jgi:hypothetical protein